MSLPKTLHMLKHIAVVFAAAAILLAQAPQASGAPAAILMREKFIYDNALTDEWDNWSWYAITQENATTPVHSGPHALAVTITQPWGALSLHNYLILSTAGYTHLRFYIHGGPTGGQHILLTVNKDTAHSYDLTAPAGAWGEVMLPLAMVGSPAVLEELWFQGAVNSPLPTFYLDDIALVNPDTAYQPRVWTPMLFTPGFLTLPPGSPLPSDAECAARVRKTPENKGDNSVFNTTPGSQRLPADFYGSAVDPRANTVIAARVTGNFTGTTDEILQWAACKWGVDENLVRAQAAIESWWHQDTLGDWTTVSTRCAPGRGLGVDGQANMCPESFGILQTRYPYMQDAWPSMANSTAFNADLAYAGWRSCYEGYEWWLNDVERGWDYAAGDAYGCVGRWFSGRWHTQPAEDYIARVKENYEKRIWTTPDFQEP